MDRQTRFHSYAAGRIRDDLEIGQAPWQLEIQRGYAPYNPLSGDLYRGLNQLILLSAGFGDPRWLLRTQAVSLGCQVSEQEKSTYVAHWDFSGASNTGEAAMYAAGLVNAEQVDGLGEFRAEDLEELDLAKIVQELGCESHVRTDHSKPLIVDEIIRFGHQLCIDRGIEGPILGEEDARKMLVRAMVAMQMSGTCGFPQNLVAFRAYSEKWLEIIDCNPKSLFSASKEADDVVQMLFSRSQSLRMASIASRLEYHARPLVESQRLRYINVPFTQRNEAQKRGARWSARKKSWYVPRGVGAESFRRWWPSGQGVPTRSYLAVPYEERNAAASVGAKLDPEAKSWYIDVFSERDAESVKPWIPRDPGVAFSKSSNEQDFLEFLRSHGVEPGEELRMDGRTARVPVAGDTGRKMSGAYKMFMDGVPSGLFTNFRTGETHSWSASIERMPKEDWLHYRAIIAQASYDRREKRLDRQFEMASMALSYWRKLPEFEVPNSYMLRKGIGIIPGIHEGPQGAMVVPLFDVQGDVWGLQTITEGGAKEFMAGCRIEGVFFVAGGTVDDVLRSDLVLIAEGVSTAMSVHQASERPVVAAMQASNLVNVAKEFRSALPDTRIVLVADNDMHLEFTNEKNVGVLKAHDASVAVGGEMFLPPFDPFVWPANIQRPKKGDKLSDEQKKIIERLRARSDFNDYARIYGKSKASVELNNLINSLGPAAKKEAQDLVRSRRRGVRI